MRWFKHDCDMHTDLKIVSLIGQYGIEGYALFNLCLEMVGKEGKEGRIDGKLRWQDGILKVLGWSDKKKLEGMLNGMAELDLICSKSLNYGNLYIPNFIKRSDDYTVRKHRNNSEVSSDNVPLEQNRYRREKKYIRTEYKDIYTSLLSYWNSKKIIVHKDILERTYGTINAKLDSGYTEDEIKKAIDNYTYILSGSDYYWNYKWTFQDFLMRGLDKFIDLEVAKQKYKVFIKGAENEVKKDSVRIRKEMLGENSSKA